MPYSFQPKVLLSVFCLILLITFSSLGLWQLQRADEKQQKSAELESLAQLPPSSLNQNKSNLRPSIKALATGRYIEENQFFLDNIVHQGRLGYYLFTPFALTDSKQVVLVNRGWLPKPKKGLPETATTGELVTLEGVMSQPRSKPVILGGIDHPVSDTPALWYYMDMEVFGQTTGYELLPLVLRLNPDSESKFVRDWPKYQAKSGMHIGYAVQWFVFAFFVLIALLGINFKKATNSDNN